MSKRLTRQLFVSALVLGSFGTITDGVRADEPRPVMIPFKCTTPMFGAERCGDENRNLHVGAGKRLTISWETGGDKDTCMTFYVMHAVSGKELARSGKELCKAPKADRTWANPKDESVDVYVMVKSKGPNQVDIGGWYIIDVP